MPVADDFTKALFGSAGKLLFPVEHPLREKYNDLISTITIALYLYIHNVRSGVEYV
jgi:hypothetical protein